MVEYTNTLHNVELTDTLSDLFGDIDRVDLVNSHTTAPDPDALHTLLEREKSLPRVELNSLWLPVREKVIEWLYRIADECKIDRVIVATSAKLVDRFLSIHRWESGSPTHGVTNIRRSSPEEQRYMLLSALTALALSDKIVSNPIIGLSNMASLSRGHFSVDELERHELKMLTTLDWRVSPPVSQQFLSEYSLLLPLKDNKNVVIECAKFQVELAVLSSNISAEHSASDIALGALLNALDKAITTSSRPDRDLSHVDQRGFEKIVSTIAGDANLIPSLGDVRGELYKLFDQNSQKESFSKISVSPHAFPHATVQSY